MLRRVVVAFAFILVSTLVGPFLGLFWIIIGQALRLPFSFSNWLDSHGGIAFLIFGLYQGVLGGTVFGAVILIRKRSAPLTRYEASFYAGIVAISLLAYALWLTDFDIGFLDWLFFPFVALVQGFLAGVLINEEARQKTVVGAIKGS